jgi:hypothetical protein
MRLLFHSFLAASAAFLFSSLSADSAAAETLLSDRFVAAGCAGEIPAATDWYAQMSSLADSQRNGLRVAVAVDLDNSPGFGADESGVQRYRMAFNNVAEGWSWQPLAQPESEDYYRWKFFPLQSVTETRQAYTQEEKIGEPQQTRVEWRYDYFLAFDNPYDFYPRVADDDAGFVIPSIPPAASLRLVALAVLGEPALSESTTFWKAIYSRPVDFTLKKRYLIGRLEALLVCDGASGKELARIKPGVAAKP